VVGFGYARLPLGVGLVFRKRSKMAKVDTHGVEREKQVYS
jgi:hypothetical protein